MSAIESDEAPLLINTGMNTTGIDLYHYLARRKVTWSRRDCSQFLLGMNPSYLAQRGDRELSERALINLFQHLWGEHRFWLCWKVARIILWRRPSNRADVS